MTVVDPQRKMWTREEYYRLGEEGWFEGQRVQLIEGDIVEMSPQGSRHAAVVSALQEALRAAWQANVHMRTQLPLALGQRSEPEPDLAVVEGRPLDYASAHPRTALLVVEVADTSLSFDRRQKQSLYAKAALAEYWIVDLVGEALEVYRAPAPDASLPFGFGYEDRRVLRRGERISPVSAPPGVEIAVDDLLA